MLDGKKVLAIGDGAFRDDTFIKKVVIEDGIESIGSNAFLSCYNLCHKFFYWTHYTKKK